MANTSHDQIFADQLRARARSLGPAPLVTYYDAASGERTELSAVSFLNWVDKTSNLLIDEIGLDEGDLVALPLAVTAPGHWITLIWEAAVWQIGASIVGGNALGEATPDLTVLGPDWAGNYDEDNGTRPSGEWVACALHPLGLGFSAELPDGLMDFALEVRVQPDVFAGAPVPSTEQAWNDGVRELTQNDLVTTVPPTADRMLVRAGEPWATVRDALIAPVLGGGSSVVIAGDPDEERLARIIETERVTVAAEAAPGDSR